ncbi:Mannosyl-D-glycerate transport/metabolism system repressor MngR [Pseudovibrio axinellae]|uniref:Mannosyl-D-glycerate transport/metabolism system repressor MngR n=2 Tax=Pseudovibrio axinellae TaxID=989403 RepID=A0A166A7P5_9HYPH|nr:Mannosyl-D-glycerate transport/metabolism system repressor MngR [Pseudovibrio axinellae]SER25270.1 GntR family transcriptional regulator, phosphonate transport system regulatory protein [Pseudovibrio axinellae]
MKFEFSPIERRNGVAMWKQIAENLRAVLSRSEVSSGEKIPTEQELAHAFGVNRHTVRRAISTLIEEGFLRADQGRGTFVVKAPLVYPIGPRTRFTENLSGQAQEVYGDIFRVSEVVADAYTGELLNVELGTPLFKCESVSYADATPLIAGTRWFEASRFPNLPADLKETSSITKIMEKYGLGEYRRKETRITAALCSAENAELLKIPEGAPVLIMESINVTEGGKAIQVGRAYVAADRMHLTVRNE